VDRVGDEVLARVGSKGTHVEAFKVVGTHSSYAQSWIRSSSERIFVVSSFALLRKRGELSSQ
jgi:hypothetical protein